MEKAYKCRLYPNREQATLIEQTFGACRWVWNTALETRNAAYKVARSVEESGGEYRWKKSLTYYDLQKTLKQWRLVHPWLDDVPQKALYETLRDLDKAYSNFFRRVKNGEKPGFPKFKSKKHPKRSYRTQANGVRVIDEKHVRLPKLGVVRCRVTQPIEGRMLSATISRSPSGKYYVSICCTDVPEPEMPLGDNDMLGIDVGIKDLMVRSDGEMVPNGKHLKKAEKKLRREQRRLSRRKKGSANWKKQKLKVARVHEKVANQRRDAIHKATTQAVRESKAIAVEDLNVRGMTHNRHLAKAVSDASMSEIHRQLQYKCEWYGRTFVRVDRWFPSSKTCGECGCVFDGLTLDMREWECPECGAVHDRDLNAARNIAREGARLIG